MNFQVLNFTKFGVKSPGGQGRFEGGCDTASLEARAFRGIKVVFCHR